MPCGYELLKCDRHMKLLVAVDHSDASQAVLKEVATRPWPPNSTVEVLHVLETAQTGGAELAQNAIGELRAGGLDATAVSVQGDAKRMILARADETKPDFVFVGSKGASALARFLLGSVASAVVGHAPCSVEIVRKNNGKSPGVKKILLATDGSDFAERAARSIADRPWPARTEVEVLSVVELHLGTAQALFEPPFMDTEQLESQRVEAMERAENAVATAVEILSKTFPKVAESISVLLDGPKAVIIEEADKIGADLIVVGSHGHRGVERFLLGSVSEAVALGAHCSVEVIR
jgi:nucleotide-binding universal stress UspA family protein